MVDGDKESTSSGEIKEAICETIQICERLNHTKFQHKEKKVRLEVLPLATAILTIVS